MDQGEVKVENRGISQGCPSQTVQQNDVHVRCYGGA